MASVSDEETDADRRTHADPDGDADPERHAGTDAERARDTASESDTEPVSCPLSAVVCGDASRSLVLAQVPELVRELLTVSGQSRGEERERRLDLAWLKLKQTVRRKCSLFEHLQVSQLEQVDHLAVIFIQLSGF